MTMVVHDRFFKISFGIFADQTNRYDTPEHLHRISDHRKSLVGGAVLSPWLYLAEEEFSAFRQVVGLHD